MTRDEFVNELLQEAKLRWAQTWRALPDEQRLRLAGMEDEVRCIVGDFQQGLWKMVGDSLNAWAVEQEGQCGCGRRRERRKDCVKLDVLGQRIEFPCTYLYCRVCHQGVNPVRRWLGLEHGGVSVRFERARTDLTTRMTFGDAVESMSEHHQQKVDRTKAERVTYAVGHHAVEYLRQRREQAREANENLESENVEQLLFTADGGAIPIGEFSRPVPKKARKNAPRIGAQATQSDARDYWERGAFYFGPRRRAPLCPCRGLPHRSLQEYSLHR